MLEKFDLWEALLDHIAYLTRSLGSYCLFEKEVKKSNLGARC